MDEKLVLQFSDGFDNDFDSSRWTLLERYHSPYNKTQVRCEEGYAVLEAETTHPPGPVVLTNAGFATKEKYFNPGLSGTNIFEISFIDHTHSGDFLNKYWSIDGGRSSVEDPVVGRYLMGWGITIGNYTGFVGLKKGRSKDRAVQFHFDEMSKIGLYSYLCRAIVPGDEKKYPSLDRKKLPRIMANSGDDYPTYPYRSRDDCTVLEVRHHPVGTRGDSGIEGDSSGHRYGIKLSDDGNSISWMLDGKVMDTYDITGYFSSSPGILDDGLYISIGANASYQRSVWRFDDASVYVTK